MHTAEAAEGVIAERGGRGGSRVVSDEDEAVWEERIAQKEMATACMALVDFNPEGRSSVGKRKERLEWGRG